MYGDTQVIRGLARSLREQADAIDREGADLLRQAEATHWSGLAADAMRVHARVRVDTLHRTAGLHRCAADALELHAAEVDRLKALIATIEREVLALVSAARDRLQSLAQSLLAGLHAIAPDPLDLLLDRFVPPPHDSMEWLSVEVPGAGLAGLL